MVQLYQSLAQLLVLFFICLFSVCTIYYLIQASKYRKTPYYHVTHFPLLKVWRNTGLYGEYLIWQTLNELSGPSRFLFNLYLPKEHGETTEIDVLLIHESGLYVFESKNYSGWIFGTDDQKTWTQTLQAAGKIRKNHFLNPIMQNKLHIKYLKAQLSDYPQIPFHSFVIFSNRCELKKIQITQTQSAVEVIQRRLALRKVQEAAQKTGSILSEKEIKVIYNRLYPWSQVTDELKQMHIDQIREQNAHGSPRKTLAKKRSDAEMASATQFSSPGKTLAKKIRSDAEQKSKPVTAPAAQSADEPAAKTCPRCGKPMVIRKAKRGKHAGESFWGCSGYPRCRYIETMQEVRQNQNT